MINSICYPQKGLTDSFTDPKMPFDSYFIAQIIFMKVFVLLCIIFLPLFLKEDTACFSITISIAF